MFDSTSVITGLPDVHTCEDLVALLSSSVSYTFGDKLIVGNVKVGSNTITSDADHPDWEWTPISGDVVAITVSKLVGNDYIIFATGYRDHDRAKDVLCIYSTSASDKATIVAKLGEADGDSTIGAKLATMLGYADWAVLGHSTATADMRYTSVTVGVSGVETAVSNRASLVSLDLPDDGGHSYDTVYSPYSGLMLMDNTVGVPTMIMSKWNPDLQPVDLVMCKSTYDADYQNTVDIVHDAISNVVNATSATVAGLVTANGALYAAIADMPLFGTRFIDVVNAFNRINASAEYIPRP